MTDKFYQAFHVDSRGRPTKVVAVKGENGLCNSLDEAIMVGSIDVSSIGRWVHVFCLVPLKRIEFTPKVTDYDGTNEREDVGQVTE